MPARRRRPPIAADDFAQPPPQPIARHRTAQLARGGDAHARFVLLRRRGARKKHEMRLRPASPALVDGAILRAAMQARRPGARGFNRGTRHSRRPACAPWPGGGPARLFHSCWPCARESHGSWRDGGDSAEKCVSAWLFPFRHPARSTARGRLEIWDGSVQAAATTVPIITWPSRRALGDQRWRAACASPQHICLRLSRVLVGRIHHRELSC